MSVKNRIDAFDLTALVYELASFLTEAKIVNVYAINETFIFKLRSRGAYFFLVFNPKIGVYLTKYEFDMPKRPPDFVVELRRYIRGGIISDIQQLNRDRILMIEIKRREARIFLILEFVREGNLIVADSDLKILLALRYRKMKDRNIVKGVKYSPPPRGLDPFKADPEKVYEKIKNEKNLFRAFLKILNVPPSVIREVFYNLGIDNIKQVDVSTVSSILDNIKNMYTRVSTGMLEPCIVYREGKPISFSPILFNHLRGRLKTFNTFNKVLDEYFTKSLFKVHRKDVELEKYSKQVRDIEKTIKEYEEKERETRKIAELLMANLNVVDFLLRKIRTLKQLDSKLVNSLEERGVKIISLDMSRKTIEIEIEDKKIVLNLEKSAGENASTYYEEAKKYRKKAARAREVLKDLKEKLETENQYTKVVLKLRSVKKWYEKFRWFISSDGFLVVGGKDASQNEALVKKYMEPSDLFFHADIYGSPVVLVKSRNKSIPKRTIVEAAQFTASYSRAWEAGFYSIDVYWVYPNQVSKKTPAGEYMRKGSFMIYGKRNYLKNVPLALAIGLLLKNSSYELICGPPPPVVKKTPLYVLLIPGRMNREKTAKHVLKIFNTRMLNYFKEKEIVLKIDLQQILNLLPKGGFHIVKKPDKVLEQLERYYAEEIGKGNGQN